MVTEIESSSLCPEELFEGEKKKQKRKKEEKKSSLLSTDTMFPRDTDVMSFLHVRS